VSAFATVVAAVENVTRIRRRLETKVIADCPLCSRPRRLEVAQQASGKVLFLCHAGCDRESLRERVGLDWRDFFEDAPFRPAPKRSAAQHVLHAVGGTRWTIVTHAFGADRDLALAVEIVERLLPARHAVRALLRLKNGIPIAWHEFPLTVGFFMEVARKLGHPIGEHRAQWAIDLLVERGVIERLGPLVVVDGENTRVLPVFRLPLRTMRSWDRPLRNALEAAALLVSPSSGKAPATGTLLSAGDLLSTLGSENRAQSQATQNGCGALGRSPPCTPGSEEMAMRVHESARGELEGVVS
jgi:hypothetical protein